MKMRRQGGWSFVIVLIIIVSVMGSYSLVKANSDSKIEYLNVKIEQGDTLWGLSTKYKENHTYTTDGFVKWVESTNGVQADSLQPGDTVKIPVERQIIQVASK
ncbi:cell division suppressor protein YneA [Pseudalkalibacillus berkeleyi]|uniref:LysM peptidoglycan-binding domain-containing protein n=1 Tax=Pseudalkalibacillus berkeleyi TaxID=1069813 RepID=A0ABS9H035_9BACL|nr:LysM peptidoglycan-binding domain-containing protein [Pseudalkalibacillus berkeleyi]MCF6137208.1 LysM peptidoglycan-binding domain-containing protein [Pseudalkalibacillus berkeleyi]